MAALALRVQRDLRLLSRRNHEINDQKGPALRHSVFPLSCLKGKRLTDCVLTRVVLRYTKTATKTRLDVNVSLTWRDPEFSSLFAKIHLLSA